MNPLLADHAVLDSLAGPTGLKLALALLHFLWQGVLIAAVAAVLIRLFGRRSPQRRYVIGVAGMALMAVAPVVTFCLVTPPALPPIEPVPIVDASELLVDLEQVDAFLTTLGSGKREFSDELTELSRVPLPEDRLTWGERFTLLQPYAVLLWLVGSLLCGLRLVIGAYSSLRCRRGRRVVPDTWCDAILKAAERIDIKRPRVFASDRVAEAIAVGLLRPMVLLPAAWIGRIPPDVLEAVLAHELAHIRRYDLWVNLFQRVVESLLFYHPAVWWLSRRVRLERENCCDDAAAKAVASPAAYARALEYVATERVAGGRTELFQAALAAGMRGEDSMALLNRVHRVLGNDNRPRRIPRLSEGLLALAVPVALWAAVVTIGPAFAQEESVEAPQAEPTLDDVVEDIHRDFDVQPGSSLGDMVEGLAQNDDSRSDAAADLEIGSDGELLFSVEPKIPTTWSEFAEQRADDELHDALRDLREELQSLRNEVEELRSGKKDSQTQIPGIDDYVIERLREANAAAAVRDRALERLLELGYAKDKDPEVERLYREQLRKTQQRLERAYQSLRQAGIELPSPPPGVGAGTGDHHYNFTIEKGPDGKSRIKAVNAGRAYVPPDAGPTTQIRFTGPAGMTISGVNPLSPIWQGSAPMRLSLSTTESHNFEFSHIPGRKGLKLNARLQLPPAGPIAEAFLSKNAVPLELTEEDLDQIAKTPYVTKVVYLPKAEHRIPISPIRVFETLVSTRLDPGVDPIAEGMRRGQVVAVLNIVRHPLPLPKRKLANNPAPGATGGLSTRADGPSANDTGGKPPVPPDGKTLNNVAEDLAQDDDSASPFYNPPKDRDDLKSVLGNLRDELKSLRKDVEELKRPSEARPSGSEDAIAPGATTGSSTRADGPSANNTGGRTAVAPDRLTTVIRGDRIVTYRIGSDFDLLEVNIQQSELPKSEEDVQSILQILKSLFGKNRPVWAESSRWKKLDDDRVELEITLWNGSTPTFLLSEHDGRLRIKPLKRFFLSDGSQPFVPAGRPPKKAESPVQQSPTKSGEIVHIDLGDGKPVPFVLEEIHETPDGPMRFHLRALKERKDGTPVHSNPNPYFSQVIETDDAGSTVSPFRSNRDVALETALEKPVSLHFEKTPLTHVIATLRNIADINIIVDDQGLMEEGVSLETPVSVNVDNLPIHETLSTVLSPLNLTATTEDGVVVITSRQRAKGPLVVETYPVADLVLPRPRPNELLGGQPSVELTPEGKTQAAAHFDNLIDLITANVEPGSWEQVGGQGVIRPNDTTLSLVVRQTRDVHDEIHGLLEQLRQMRRSDSDAVLEPDKINREHFTPKNAAADAADKSPSPAGKTTSVKVRVEQAGTYYVDGYAASATGLASAIKEAMADGDRTELVIQADKAAPFSAVARVIEAAKEIGVDKIRFATEPGMSANEDLSGETSDNEAKQDGKTATVWDKLVSEYNDLIRQRNFAEALTIAKKIRELDPENQTAVTMYYKAKVLLEKTRQPSPDRPTSTEALFDSTLEIEPGRKDFIRELQKQIENLKKQLEETQSADNAADASDKKPNDGEREKDKGEVNEPRTEIDMLRAIVQGLIGNLDELPQKPPVPLTGEVLATAKAPGSGNKFVEISLGSDDGLRKGVTQGGPTSPFRTGRVAQRQEESSCGRDCRLTASNVRQRMARASCC